MVSSIQRVSGELGISRSSIVHYLYNLGKSSQATNFYLMLPEYCKTFDSLCIMIYFPLGNLNIINSIFLDPVEDDDSVCRVPERVTLELNPKNNSAWLHVQEMAQNPRLRMTLKSDQHLSTVMSFLQKKWKPPRLKLVSFVIIIII